MMRQVCTDPAASSAYGELTGGSHIPTFWGSMGQVYLAYDFTRQINHSRLREYTKKKIGPVEEFAIVDEEVE